MTLRMADGDMTPLLRRRPEGARRVTGALRVAAPG